MTKVWNGPTPYDMKKPFDWSRDAERTAYIAAMNSSEVKAMYEALTGREWSPAQQKLTNAAIRAYKANLREVP